MPRSLFIPIFAWSLSFYANEHAELKAWDEKLDRAMELAHLTDSELKDQISSPEEANLSFDSEKLLSWGCSRKEILEINIAPEPCVPEPCEEPPPPPPCFPDYLWKAWGDFLYWQPIQENMEPATLYTSFLLIGFIGQDTGTVLNMNFDFKPGFAAGTGITIQRKFDVNAEYTRFHSTQTMSRRGNPFYPMQLDPATLFSFLLGINLEAGSGFGSAAPFAFEQKWNLDMDILDLEFGRYQFVYTVVKVHPFAGVRGARINQDLKVNYIGNLANGGPSLGESEVHMKTKSWGVGIRGGLDVTWKLGGGFKFYGIGAGDFLYTQYDWRETTNTVVSDLVNRSSNLTQKQIPTVRLHLDTELGFSWNRCYCVRDNNLGTFEVRAGYGFQVFFNQNMFRHFTTSFEDIGIVEGLPVTIASIASPISNMPNGNLYLQGLRVHASFTY